MEKLKLLKLSELSRMRALELMKLGQKYVPNFVGVFPLDKLSPKLIAPANFILNTHTHNLTGEHWLAVSYMKGGIVFAFDPFGIYYPRLLQIYLNKLQRTRQVHYNDEPLQEIYEKTCGLYCLAWLIAINSSYNNTA